MTLLEKKEQKLSLIDSNNVDDIIFPIKERPLVYHENGGPPVETDYKVLLNATSNEILYTGKIYNPICNEDLIDAVDDHDRLQLAKVRNYYGKRFELTYVMPDTKFMLGPEETFFSLNIINSYDGSTSLHVIGGLFVQICSNGAKIGKMTYQFKRKHTSNIGKNELSGFVKDSIEFLEKRTDYVASKQWSNDFLTVKEKFRLLGTVFPERKDKQLHPALVTLDKEYSQKLNRYPDQKEFALFMAATDMSSRPLQYGLGTTYTKSLDSIIGDVFFN